jgi:beta-N-acetylhexosaminidase
MAEMNGGHLILGVEGPELTERERERFRRLRPAGYILFSRNVVTPEQTRALTDALRGPHYDDPIIAIDQEGGRVTRTKEIAPTAPSAEALARHGGPPTIAGAGELTGELLRLLGCNFNFAPVLDLDHFPGRGNALRRRCWGRDPQRVIDRAGLWNRWLRKRDVRSCAKHFPAGGRAESDPHHGLPSCGATREELLAEDVIPYTALMPELDAVMLAHIRFPRLDPDLPASLSPRIVRGFLRDQLGFDRHLVITDDLDMGAVREIFPGGGDVPAALSAGNDLALICHEHERAEEAAARVAALPPGVLDDSEKRIERFRRKLPPATSWDPGRWRATCEKLAALAESVPKAPDGDAGAEPSPVADY